MPLETAGEDTIRSPVDIEAHIGKQGDLLQPTALKAYNRPSSEPTYTIPFAMVGEEKMLPPVGGEDQSTTRWETFV